MTECEHDWRIDPFMVLTTYPPQRRLVCAKCGQSKASGLRLESHSRFDPYEPEGWPRWHEPTQAA